MIERIFEGNEIPSVVKRGEMVSYSVNAGAHRLSIPMAYIEFEQSERNKWILWDLESDVEGGGRRMIAEAIGVIGRGKRIEAPITNEETIDALANMVVVKLKVLQNQQTLEIKERGVLRKLRMVYILEAGGLTTEKMVIRPPTPQDLEDEIKLTASYFGRT